VTSTATCPLNRVTDRLRSVADPVVDDLVRTMNQLVAADVGRHAGDELPRLRYAADAEALALNESLLRKLADSRDIPARLAPTPAAILARADGPDGFQHADDERPRIRQALTELVADCANSLAPAGPLPPAGDPEGRSRLGLAVCTAYAELARSRLEPALFPNGQPEDLGLVPLPDETGDAVAARALVFAITARTPQSETEDDVLKTLVQAGRGGAAQAAAQLLLHTNPNFVRLPTVEQRDAVVRYVAQELEKGFATERPLPKTENVLAYTLQERTFAANWGAGVVDDASRQGNEEVEKLRKIFDQRPRPAHAVAEPEPELAGLPTQRPASVHELVQRIKVAVGEVTGEPESVWSGEIVPMAPNQPYRAGVSDDSALLLDQDRAALPLRELTETESGRPEPIDPGQLQDVRAAFEEVVATYARWSVPPGHTARTEVAAQDASPEYNVVNLATADAFAKAYADEIARRTLPPELAKQLQVEVPLERDQLAVPAMQAFARTVENQKGLETRPSELIRRMAGQDHRGAATTVGKVLVANSRIPRELQPVAVQRIADAVVRGFDDLPERLMEEERATPSEAPAQLSRRFGMELGLEVNKLFRTFENDPEQLRGEGAEVDPNLRFVPGHDRASTAYGGSTTAAAADRIVRANSGKSRGGLDGR
jgi:hypothetical protein